MDNKLRELLRQSGQKERIIQIQNVLIPGSHIETTVLTSYGRLFVRTLHANNYIWVQIKTPNFEEFDG